MIHFDNEITGTYTSMKQFTDFLIQRSADPALYDRDYFLSYLDKNIHWEGDMLNNFFTSDKLSLDNVKTYTTLSLALSEIYNENEVDSIKVPYHLSAKIKDSYKNFRFNLLTPMDNSPITMRQVLNNMIKWFIIGWRGANFSHHLSYLRVFTETNTARPKTKLPDRMSDFAAHRKHGNILCHRMIDLFVTSLHKSREELMGKTETRVRNSFMFFYTDIVSPSFCGSTKLKILNVMPYFLNAKYSYSFHQTDYYPVEKSIIKSISIEIRNERGDLMDFLPGTTPTFVTLLFRKVEGVSKSIH